MKTLSAQLRLAITIIGTISLLMISGCSSNFTGYSSDGGRAYYDQYVDRPGYYDFGEPVIFTHDDSTGVN